MKCPLLAIAGGGFASKQQEIYPDCLEEKCAWWDLEGQQCILLTAGLALINADQRLKQLVEKIPHAGQFLK